MSGALEETRAVSGTKEQTPGREAFTLAKMHVLDLSAHFPSASTTRIVIERPGRW
jgi:hypothetical protein